MHLVFAVGSAAITGSSAAVLSLAVGIAGLLVAAARELAARADRRRARPVVLCHELAPPAFAEDESEGLVMEVWLGNVSAATALNVRFGVTIGGHRLPWSVRGDRPAQGDRVNVLRPAEALPDEAQRVRSESGLRVRIPGAFGFALAGRGDVWEQRGYWVDYQSAGGEWWSTLTPLDQTKDVQVHRIGGRAARWLQERRTRRTLTRGKALGQQLWRELQAAADPEAPEPADRPRG